MGRTCVMAEDQRLKLVRLELEPYGTNAYLIQCRLTGASCLVDAPGEPAHLTAFLEDQDLRQLLLTHSHPDHIGALDVLRQLGAPLGAHADDSLTLRPPPERLLTHGDKIEVGELTLQVLHTPGHTAGSLCFHLDSHLLAGDTIFPGGPGRTASPPDFQTILSSIRERVLTLPAHTTIYPGHGGPTTVAQALAEYRQFASRVHAPDLYGDVLWNPPE